MPLEVSAISEVHTKSVAIVDYGLGNLFSVAQACRHVGMSPMITATSKEILEADVVILPGVGAFGDAMEHLEQLDLVVPLQEVAQTDKPLIAICLGMQLLMTESEEFGNHRGLGIVDGPVFHLTGSLNATDTAQERVTRNFKVPEVGWNHIYRPQADGGSSQSNSDTDSWSSSPLSGIENGEYMYFVHSYYVQPEDQNVVLSLSQYGDFEFCSSLNLRNIYGFQFHPERSGLPGLQIYQNIHSNPKSQVTLRRAADE